MHPLQPQTEDLQELSCVSSFCRFSKFGFHFLANIRNILNATQLIHCSPSNQRTGKYICQALLAKLSLTNVCFPSPYILPHLMQLMINDCCCCLMSLNLQHCPLRYAWCCNTFENLKRKQTGYFIPEEKDFLEGRVHPGRRTFSSWVLLLNSVQEYFVSERHCKGGKSPLGLTAES